MKPDLGSRFRARVLILRHGDDAVADRLGAAAPARGTACGPWPTIVFGTVSASVTFVHGRGLSAREPLGDLPRFLVRHVLGDRVHARRSLSWRRS